MKTLAEIEATNDLDARVIGAAALLEANLRPAAPSQKQEVKLGELVQQQDCFKQNGFIRDVNFALGVRNAIAHFSHDAIAPTADAKSRAASFLIQAIRLIRQSRGTDADPTSPVSMTLPTSRTQVASPAAPVRVAPKTTAGTTVYSGDTYWLRNELQQGVTVEVDASKHDAYWLSRAAEIAKENGAKLVIRNASAMDSFWRSRAADNGGAHVVFSVNSEDTYWLRRELRSGATVEVDASEHDAFWLSRAAEIAKDNGVKLVIRNASAMDSYWRSRAIEDGGTHVVFS